MRCNYLKRNMRCNYFKRNMRCNYFKRNMRCNYFKRRYDYSSGHTNACLGKINFTSLIVSQRPIYLTTVLQSIDTLSHHSTGVPCVCCFHVKPIFPPNDIINQHT